jgi:hypothetical protein
MLKHLLLISFCFIGLVAKGQTDSLSKEEKRILDSMFKNDEFIKLMSKKDKRVL